MEIDPRGPRFSAVITTIVLAVVLITGSAWLLAAQVAVLRRVTTDLRLPVHIVACPIVRDPAGKLADRVHFLLLSNFILQLALRGGFQRIDDRGFLIAFFFLDRRHIKPAEALAAPDQHRIDRGDVGLAKRRLPDGRLQNLAVAFGDRGDDGALLGFAAGAVEQAREQRIGAHHSPTLVDRGDRHWRVMEEANEADLGGALRIAPGLARAIEHESA